MACMDRQESAQLCRWIKRGRWIHLQRDKSILYLKKSRLTGSGNLVLQCSNQQEMREQGLKNRRNPHPPCTKGYPTQPPSAVVYIKYKNKYQWACMEECNLHSHKNLFAETEVIFIEAYIMGVHLNLSDLNQISNKIIKKNWILQLPWFLQILKFSDPSIVAKLNSDNRDTI